MSMDLLLINHADKAEPFGLISLYQYLKLKGADVGLIGPSTFWSAGLGAHPNPDWVGFSVMHNTANQVPQAIERVKSLWPKAAVVLGGRYFCADTLFDDWAGLLSLADLVVVGDGEYVLEKMLRDLSSIGLGPVAVGNDLSQKDFNAIPLPSLDLLQEVIPDYLSSSRLRVLAGRGCPFRCTFCDSGNRAKVLRRNPEELSDYLKQLAKDTGRDDFFIYDDVFGDNKEWLERFSVHRQRKGSKLKIRCFSTASLLDEERVHWLRLAGVVNLVIGAESADPLILKLARKTSRLEDCYQAHDLCKDRISTKFLWMIGLPGESERSLRDTITHSRVLGDQPGGFSFAQPYPGTDFWRIHSHFGRIVSLDIGNWTNKIISFIPYDLSREQLEFYYREGKRPR